MHVDSGANEVSPLLMGGLGTREPSEERGLLQHHHHPVNIGLLSPTWGLPKVLSQLAELLLWRKICAFFQLQQPQQRSHL